MFIIELVGTGRRSFVEGYSNTLASPRSTFTEGQALPFGSEAEANNWAKAYLPGYNIKVIAIVPG
jgi:hypothetical protein